jgi:hypothetical protein
MQILVTGATGFVGRALILRLLRDGHRVRALVRSRGRAASLLGADVELADAKGEGALLRAVEGCDAVINLAGESVGTRWTAARKRALWDSRVKLTEELVAAIGRAERRPSVLVSASAVGYYGDRGDEPLDEGSAPGSDFLAEMCEAWEAAAQAAEQHGLRVCRVRIGLVLGRGGGVLEKLLPLFRAGLGGPLGDGRQYFPWVHQHDLVELLATATVEPRFAGPVLAVAPAAVTNREFARALGAALHRPAVLPAPKFALRLVLGEAASALVAGQRATPTRTLALGFHFQFATLGAALSDLFGGQDAPRFEPARELPPSPYLARRGARTVLRQSTPVAAPAEEVFALFARPANLGALSPAAADMRFEALPDRVEVGTELAFTVKVGPTRARWVSQVESWEPPVSFVDVQVRGPFAAWWHEHRVVRDGAGSRIEDTVYFKAPLGPLGWLAEALFVRRMLREMFELRAHTLRLRFGAGADGPPLGAEKVARAQMPGPAGAA